MTETQNAVSEMRAHLAAFRDKPRGSGVAQKISDLIGLRESILLKAVESDGAGFSTWFYTVDASSGVKSIIAYGEQRQDGPRDILLLFVEGGRILAGDLLQANLLFRIPRAENWYERWICDFTIDSKDGIFTSYLDTDLDKWDQISLTSKYALGQAVDSGVLFGEPMRFEVVSRDHVRTQFPEQYRKWRQDNDAYGRPRLILAMLERAASFDSAKVSGFDSLKFPPGLKETTLLVLNAAVADDSGTLKDLVGSYVGRDDLGGIAAVALREALRVDRVTMRQSVDQKAVSVEQFEVLFSFDAVDPADNRREARLTFERAGDRWVLKGFDTII